MNPNEKTERVNFFQSFHVMKYTRQCCFCLKVGTIRNNWRFSKSVYDQRELDTLEERNAKLGPLFEKFNISDNLCRVLSDKPTLSCEKCWEKIVNESCAINKQHGTYDFPFVLKYVDLNIYCEGCGQDGNSLGIYSAVAYETKRSLFCNKFPNRVYGWLCEKCYIVGNNDVCLSNDVGIFYQFRFGSPLPTFVYYSSTSGLTGWDFNGEELSKRKSKLDTCIKIENIKDAGRCFLGIRKFRKEECYIVGQVPMDVIKIIVGILWKTKNEHAWLF